jgi:DnaJ-class molecular chaperone
MQIEVTEEELEIIVEALSESSYQNSFSCMGATDKDKVVSSLYARLDCLEEEKDCSACGGYGRYDTFGSPPCGSCEGTGKEN